MALEEPQLLKSLQAQHHHNHQPQEMLDEKLCELVQAMEAVLNQKGVAQEEKLKLYHHVLQKYLLYNKKVQPPQVKMLEKTAPVTIANSSPEEPAVDLIETDIIQSAPKNLKQKASLLMCQLKQDDNIGWNAKGKLVYKGEVMPCTHIQDLVQDILRKQKTHIPHGWQIFAKALKESNIP